MKTRITGLFLFILSISVMATENSPVQHSSVQQRDAFERPDSPECEVIKKQKIIGKGIFVLSSHRDGKGLVYSGEPYSLYQDGCLVQKQLTNEKGEIIFDYAEEATYVLITLFGGSLMEPHRIVKK